MHRTPAAVAPSALARHWSLDDSVAFLNHGSFGACPQAVLDRQRQLQQQMERQPVRFFTRQMQPLLDQSRRALADFIHADPAHLVFVPNATSGVNAVLRSIDWRPGDAILTTNHAYNACRAAAAVVAERHGVTLDIAAVPFPLRSADEVVDAITSAVTPRTRLAMIDHVTSPTALVFPIARIVAELAQRNVDTLIDGAHAPGMLPLDLASLNAAYYTGNCHKWLCAPKSAGFLYARPDVQHRLHPTVMSHGENVPRLSAAGNANRFHDRFDWIGTIDYTPWLCVGEAIAFMSGLLPGGFKEVMRRNRDLAIAARNVLCRTLDIEPPCPDDMIGSIATVPLPDDPFTRGDLDRTTVPTPTSMLQVRLADRYAIETPVPCWPAPPRRNIRISAQLYNTIEQYERLAAGLDALLRQERSEGLISNPEHRTNDD